MKGVMFMTPGQCCSSHRGFQDTILIINHEALLIFTNKYDFTLLWKNGQIKDFSWDRVIHIINTVSAIRQIANHTERVIVAVFMCFIVYSFH